MNITIDSGVSAIIAAALAGLFAWLGNLTANAHARKLQRDLAEKELREARIAAEAAFKDRLLTIYANAISSLTALLAFTGYQDRDDKEYLEHLTNTQHWLSQVLAYHYDREDIGYKDFLKLHLDTDTTYQKPDEISNLRTYVIRFLTYDPRLK